MRKILFTILSVLTLTSTGCAQHRRYGYGYEIGENGYPIYHRNDFVYRNSPYTYQPQNINQPYMHQCEHIRQPYFQQEYVPPIYKPVLMGCDYRGQAIYQNMLIRAGFYQQVFAGYYCIRCGIKL